MAGRSVRTMGATRAAAASARSVHRAHEADAAAGDGADQPLLVAVVADRAPRGIDATRQGGIRHDAAAPDRGDEIVLADDAVAVLHEVEQEIEYLRFDGNGRGAAMQLAPVGIEHVIVKHKLQAKASPVATVGPSIKEFLKDKSIIRQSLAARLQVSEGCSMKAPLRLWRGIARSPRRRKACLCAYHFNRSKQPNPFVVAAETEEQPSRRLCRHEPERLL